MNRKSSQYPFAIARAAFMAAALALGTLSTAAHAGEWKVALTPYAWATDLGVKADLDGREVLDEKVSVTDLIEQIDMIFQGRLDVTRRQFGVSVDLFDVTMSDRLTGVALPQGAGTADFEPEMRMTLFDLAGTYTRRLKGPATITGLAGMRLVYERADVDARFDLGGGSSVGREFSTHDTSVDALLGARVLQPLSPHWALQGQVDVSTGGTRYTWSTAPSVVYAFDAAHRWALSAGYRHMHVAFRESDGLESDMTLSGALVGLRIGF